MVSARCILVVKDALTKAGVHFGDVSLGEVELISAISGDQLHQFKCSLMQAGLELIEDKRKILAEKIKNSIIEMVHYSDDIIKVNFSSYLTTKLDHDYTYMSNLFSEVQGITIEQFTISHKVERIKELIIYGELNITEIAWKMNYSSVAHLSNQFKKATGLSPSQFKQLKDKRRNTIENVGIIDTIAGYISNPLFNKNPQISLRF